ncbi:MAG: hypothetical protein ACI9FJ_001622 [Alteromonadaceae bacterium]|jgi:hypothetical protein
MITLIRSNKNQLNHHFASYLVPGDKPHLWLVKPQSGSSVFKPLRDLISQIASHAGQDKVTAILAQDQAAVSFVYQEQIGQLDQHQLDQRCYYSTRATSHLSHNWYLHRPLFEAWAKILHSLLQTADYALIAPFSGDLVGPVNGILRTFNRMYPNNAFDMTIGFETDGHPPEYDENGINWNFRSANPRFAGGFLQVADVVNTLPDNTPEMVSLDFSAIIDDKSLEHDAEHSAFELLAQTPGQLSETQAASVVAAMRLSFAGIGFQNTLALGLQLSAREPSLSQVDTAAMHGLMALCAHNRQFQTKDTRLHDFLEKHFLAAYEAETDAGMRSALGYRLAVTYGRRMKQPQEGLVWAEKAMTIASAPQLSETEQTYFYNWGVNIKSYLLMISRQLDQAFETGSAVFHTVHEHYRQVLAKADDNPGPLSQMWQRELFSTVQVLRRNMFALSFRTHHLEQFKFWLEQMELITPPSAELRRATYVEWAEYYAALHQPQKTLEAIATGFKYLNEEPDGELFLNYTELAIKANYQSGNLSAAKEQLDNYRQELDNQAMPWHFADDISKYAHVDLRSSQPDDLALLEPNSAKALQSAQTTLTQRIELLLILAQVQAKRQLQQPTEDLVNKAIELAVADGELNLMIRIARVAGLCNTWLGNEKEASEAYQQALSLSQNDSEKKIWPEELFLTLVSLQKIIGPQPPLLEKVLQLLPKALSKQEIWWQLGETLNLLNQLASQDKAAFATLVQRQPLDVLIGAAGQREDCKTALEKLMANNAPAETTAT